MSTSVRSAGDPVVSRAATSARDIANNKEAEVLEIQATQAERRGDDGDCLMLLESAIQKRCVCVQSYAEQCERQPDNLALIEQHQIANQKLYDVAERLVVKCNSFGVRSFKSGDFSTGNDALSSALQLTEEGTYPLSEVDGLRRRLRSVTLNNFGCMERVRGHFQDALECIRQSIEVTGEESAVAYMNMSAILMQLRLCEDARDMSLRAVALLAENDGMAGEDPSLLAVARHNLAMALEPDDPERCLLEYEEAYRLASSVLGADNPTTQAIERNWVRYQKRYRPHHVVQPAYYAAKRKSVNPHSLQDALSLQRPPAGPTDEIQEIFPHPFTQTGSCGKGDIPPNGGQDGGGRGYRPPGQAPPRTMIFSQPPKNENKPSAKQGSTENRDGAKRSYAPAMMKRTPPAKSYGSGSTSKPAAPPPNKSHELADATARSNFGAEKARKLAPIQSKSTARPTPPKSGPPESSRTAAAQRSGRTANAAAAPPPAAASTARVTRTSSSGAAPPLAAATARTSRASTTAAAAAAANNRSSRQSISNSGPAGNHTRQTRTSITNTGAANSSNSPAPLKSEQHIEFRRASKPLPPPTAAQSSQNALTNRETAAGVKNNNASAGGKTVVSKATKETLLSKHSETTRAPPRQLPPLREETPGRPKVTKKQRSSLETGTGEPVKPKEKPPSETNAFSATGQEATMLDLMGGDLQLYFSDRLDMLIHDEEEFERKYVKATIIQKNYRAHLSRRRVQELREGRRKEESLRHIRRSIAARIIQQAVYRHLHIPLRRGNRRTMALHHRTGKGAEDMYALKIQRIARGWIARRGYQRLQRYRNECWNASIVLQRWYRRILAEQRLSRLRSQRMQTVLSQLDMEKGAYAATKIQAIWRGHLQWKRVEKELERRRLERVLREEQQRFIAARRIQCAWRCCAAKIEAQRLRTQRVARADLRQFYVSQRNAAVKIQSYGRMLLERKKHFPELTEARGRAAKLVAESTVEYKAASTIQRVYRAHAARLGFQRAKAAVNRELVRSREVYLATVLQRVGRGYLSRRAQGREYARLGEEALNYEARLADLHRKDDATREERAVLLAAQEKIAVLSAVEDDARAELELEELRWRRTSVLERDEVVALQHAAERKPDPDAYPVRPPAEASVHEEEEEEEKKAVKEVPDAVETPVPSAASDTPVDDAGEKTPPTNASPSCVTPPPAASSSSSSTEWELVVECEEAVDSTTEYDVILEEVEVESEESAEKTPSIEVGRSRESPATPPTKPTSRPPVKAPISRKYAVQVTQMPSAPQCELEPAEPAVKPLREGRPPRELRPAQPDSTPETALVPYELSQEAPTDQTSAAPKDAVIDEATFSVAMARARAERDERIIADREQEERKQRLRQDMQDHKMKLIETAETEEELRPLLFPRGFGPQAKRPKKAGAGDDTRTFDERVLHANREQRDAAREHAAMTITRVGRGFLVRQYVKRIRQLEEEYARLREHRETASRPPIDLTRLRRYQAMYPQVRPSQRRCLLPPPAGPPIPPPSLPSTTTPREEVMVSSLPFHDVGSVRMDESEVIFHEPAAELMLSSMNEQAKQIEDEEKEAEAEGKVVVQEPQVLSPSIEEPPLTDSVTEEDDQPSPPSLPTPEVIQPPHPTLPEPGEEKPSSPNKDEAGMIVLSFLRSVVAKQQLECRMKHYEMYNEERVENEAALLEEKVTRSPRLSLPVGSEVLSSDAIPAPAAPATMTTSSTSSSSVEDRESAAAAVIVRFMRVAAAKVKVAKLRSRSVESVDARVAEEALLPPSPSSSTTDRASPVAKVVEVEGPKSWQPGNEAFLRSMGLKDDSGSDGEKPNNPVREAAELRSQAGHVILRFFRMVRARQLVKAVKNVLEEYKDVRVLKESQETAKCEAQEGEPAQDHLSELPKEMVEAGRKITNFIRRVLAHRRLQELRLAHLERIAESVQKDNAVQERSTEETGDETKSEGDVLSNTSSEEARGRANHTLDPYRATAPPDHDSEESAFS